jgi:hypothetical protein
MESTSDSLSGSNETSECMMFLGIRRDSVRPVWWFVALKRTKMVSELSAHVRPHLVDFRAAIGPLKIPPRVGVR